MSEHDDRIDEHDYEEVPPRSIFAATWFRVVLVLIVVGVVGAVAVPYVLDWMNPPPMKPTIAAKAPAPVSTPPASPSAAEKKDSTLIPVPSTPPMAAPPPESKTSAAVPEAKSKSAMAVTETPPKPAAKPEPTKPELAGKSDTVTKSGGATKPTVAAKPDVTVKPSVTARPDITTKPESTPKPDMLARADTAKPKDDPKPAVAAKTAPTPKRAAVTATTPSAAPASGQFWVQVGAFRDAETARKVAAKLREENFSVEASVKRTSGGAAARSAPTPSVSTKASSGDLGADKYDVLVSGQTADELTKRLAAKGLAAEASGSGMIVKPSLPLRDAVALSKDLAVEGFKVQVRRAGGSMAAATASSVSSAPAASVGGSELHRVRVGAFPDRAAAQAALRQLEAKGYKPYIARGDQ